MNIQNLFIGRLQSLSLSLSILFSLCKCFITGILTSSFMKSFKSLYKKIMPKPTNIPITSPKKKAATMGVVKNSILPPFSHIITKEFA